MNSHKPSAESLLRAQRAELHRLFLMRSPGESPVVLDAMIAEAGIDLDRLYGDQRKLGSLANVTEQEYLRFGTEALGRKERYFWRKGKQVIRRAERFPEHFIPKSWTRDDAEKCRQALHRPKRAAAEKQRRLKERELRVQAVASLSRARSRALLEILSADQKSVATLMRRVRARRIDAFRDSHGILLCGNSLRRAILREAERLQLSGLVEIRDGPRNSAGLVAKLIRLRQRCSHG